MSLSAGSTSFAESDTVGTCKDTKTLMTFSDTETDFDHFWSFSPSDDPFIMNPLTGELCLTEQIDYELHSQFVLTVQVVRDTPTNVYPNIPTGQSETLTITITDTNDERPVVHGLTDYLQISAGAVAGNLMTFTVSDRDTTGTIVTTMTAQTPDDALFSMAACSTSCTLALAASPDPDTMNADSYKVTIQVTDGANTVTTYVWVDIITANDITPVLAATPASPSVSCEQTNHPF